MALQNLIRFFLPREDKFFRILEEHASIVAETAAVMTHLPLGNGRGDEALEQVHQLEHRGDDLVREMNLALDETFVTPIDREDLHTLSNKLDDVLDYIYAAAQAFVTYHVLEKTAAMEQMLKLLSEATTVLREAVPQLRQHRFDQIAPARTRIVALEKRIDGVYREEMKSLYRNPAIDAKELLRQQSVLNALEAAMDTCQDAADVLENIAVKHA